MEMPSDAMLVSLRGAQTWPPEINENIWNLLLLFNRLLLSLLKQSKFTFILK